MMTNNIQMSRNNKNFKQDASYLGFLVLLLVISLYALTRVSQ